ncbi:hypothetical protein L1049_010403 [Liquidambar formosana]|uniref:Senescence regulator n=1 Tax=Liquidambar formosana TaxID=63359 RepID=A0AAP0N9S6_LIQFO
MAKGRKLTTSRSERFLGGSFGYGHGQGTGTADVSELGEDDVWSIVDRDAHSTSPQSEWTPREASESNGTHSIRTRRRLPRDDDNHRHVGGLSLAFDDMGRPTSSSSRIIHQFRPQDGGVAASPRGHHMATSAPVNVPDWHKILRVDSSESMHDSDDWLDDRESEMVPPHEYLAREYARSRGATSVFEGVGRTLKGRDMSRVRDAVWSQTGFDG